MRTPSRILAAAMLAALTALGCNDASPLTQLVVVVDTDLQVPTQATELEVVVVAPDSTTQRAAGPLTGEAAIALPATLGVVHRGGPLGPVEITARALLGETEVVVRRARVFMIRDRTMRLELHLERVCLPAVCGEDETCEHGECRPVLVDATELRPHEGEIPRLTFDGGTSDGCGTSELCNGVDDDCDDRIDEDFGLDVDPRNCGGCGNVCPTYAGSYPACEDGRCTIACTEGRGDCDGEPRNGCETPLDSLTMCAECGRECRVDHGTPTCFGSVCAVFDCAPGWGNCDGEAGDGCEQRLDDLAHCGGCGAACAPANAVPSCAAGVCGIAACGTGWANCDSEVSNGCERPVDTITDCGACDAACPSVEHGAPGCIAGGCGIERCDVGWGDCNGMANDGCETPLDTLTDCGGCGTSCALLHASEICGPTGCEIGACDPGWGDCDGLDATGCEASLETAARCGACDVSCAEPTPLCSVGGTGARSCGSACAPEETLCGTECAALDTSLDHCGGCDQPCAPANASALCGGGVCAIAACDPGWADCNGAVSDGCETPLDTLTDCGACGVACDLAGASETCMGGRCAISACDAGVASCDGSAANGCETPLDTLTDCGGCGVACALPNASESCATGVCTLGTCDEGWGDCNGMAVDGCETRLDSLAHCGGCAQACDLPRAQDTCEGGVCGVLSCDMEWADCDGEAWNGCEQSLRTLAHCGACGTTCGPFPNASASCADGSCAITCDALYGDCDPGAAGCETRLDSLDHCGACDTACTVGPNATATCDGGVCAVASCTRPDRGDCNGETADGCEARLDSDEANCGMCGRVCARGEECNGGRCRRD